MKEFELKAVRTEKVVFTNNLPPDIKIQLSNKYSYNVGYSDNNTCSGEFTAEIFDKDMPDRFKIEVSMRGFFTICGTASKEILHIKTYDCLFTYVKAFIATLTANSGIPVINIPYVDISDQNIYRVEMPGMKK